MNVTIRERTAVYIPDYTPTNPAWKIQLQDAHRLVVIAGIECFVKRFERLLPAWSFLVANRGLRHVGLPLIYDAQSRNENGRTVYYLFLEKVEGELLHDVVRLGGSANGSTLGRSMAAAFRVLRAQGYWHADFCTKNIMVTTASKQFVLIDLDSLEPAGTFPNTARNQPGYIPDQELAVYALNYVKTYVQPAIKAFSFFPGPALNVVQLIFLLDKLVYFAVVLKPHGAKFGQKKNFENLPETVHTHLAPYTDRLVKNVLDGKSVTDEMLLSQGSNFQVQLKAAPVAALSSLPSSKVIPQTKSTTKDPKITPAVGSPAPKPVAPPATKKPTTLVVVTFTASSYSVKSGETTSIVWQVLGASTVNISNIGAMAATGVVTLNSTSFSGRTAFELTAGNPAIRKTIFIDFPQLAPTAGFLTPPTSLANKAKILAPLPKPPIVTAAEPKSNFWLIAVGAFLLLALIIAVTNNKPASLTAQFVPSQARGLQLFDRGEYDSSFVHLINFRHDTSQHFATQYNLARMYSLGIGANRNDTLAVNLYYQCLRSPTPMVASNALYYLGMSYLLGEGSSQDINEAKKCFAYAVKNYNNQQARKELQKLGQVTAKSDVSINSVTASVEKRDLGQEARGYKEPASLNVPATQVEADINTNQENSSATDVDDDAQTEKVSPERILVYKSRINKHPTNNGPETSDISGGGRVQSYCHLISQPHDPSSDELIKIISPGRYALIISRLPQERHQYYLVFVDGHYGYLASECIGNQ